MRCISGTLVRGRRQISSSNAERLSITANRPSGRLRTTTRNSHVHNFGRLLQPAGTVRPIGILAHEHLICQQGVFSNTIVRANVLAGKVSILGTAGVICNHVFQSSCAVPQLCVHKPQYVAGRVVLNWPAVLRFSKVPCFLYGLSRSGSRVCDLADTLSQQKILTQANEVVVGQPVKC